MKVLLSWLREFAPFEETAVELGQVMDDLGMAVEELRPVALDGIVVARVVQTRPHPDADRIQLVDVETGGDDALQVCCGAFNMAVGDLVPLATVGTTMPNGLEIARRKMRGEWSNGMLCSPVELGLGDDAGGILILPDDLEPGLDLAALGLDGEALYDLEINPNRPDAMSIAGVARDLAARLDLPFQIPVPEPLLGDTEVAVAASVEDRRPRPVWPVRRRCAAGRAGRAGAAGHAEAADAHGNAPDQPRRRRLQLRDARAPASPTTPTTWPASPAATSGCDGRARASR